MNEISPMQLILAAPVIGVQVRDRSVFHAIEWDGIKFAIGKNRLRRVPRAACGVPVRLLPGETYTVPIHYTNGETEEHEITSVLPWPPRVASLPEGRSRCKACFDATGRMRPRCEFKHTPFEERQG